MFKLKICIFRTNFMGFNYFFVSPAGFRNVTRLTPPTEFQHKNKFEAIYVLEQMCILFSKTFKLVRSDTRTSCKTASDCKWLTSVPQREYSKSLIRSKNVAEATDGRTKRKNCISYHVSLYNKQWVTHYSLSILSLRL